MVIDSAITKDDILWSQNIREQFPALTLSLPEGKPLTYLDSAASAQKPRCVIDGIKHFYENSYANVHRSIHHLAEQATIAFEGARKKTAAFLNAPAPENIIFTRGTTEAINLLASSFGQTLNSGDEIILSIMEHHSNIVPWHFLRQQKGVVLKWIGLTDEGEFDWLAFEAAFSKRTKLVSITHMSNVLGFITPAKQIIEYAHDLNVPVFLDGSQAAVHHAVDLQELDVDFYAITGHKLYGPSGIGALYMTSSWMDRLPPYHGGGEMIDEVHLDHITYADPPYKFEAGTPPIAQAVGLGIAVDWLKQIQPTALLWEQQLYQKAFAIMQSVGGMTIFGNALSSSIITFNMENVHPYDLATYLGGHGIAIRAGHHCAQPLMRHFQQEGTARFSLACYNNHDDLIRLEHALQSARQLFQ